MQVAAALDTVLDRTVALGHGDVGLRVRRHLPKGVRDWLPVFRALTGPIIRSPEEGADTIVWLGGAPEALESTGEFWHDRGARPTHYPLGAPPDDPIERRRLWELCQSLIGSSVAEPR